MERIQTSASQVHFPAQKVVNQGGQRVSGTWSDRLIFHEEDSGYFEDISLSHITNQTNVTETQNI
jgi:hypothetical protein